MLVKIGNLVFSSADQPIMVVLSNADIKGIRANASGDGAGVKHVSAPSRTTQKEINRLMKADKAERVVFSWIEKHKADSEIIGATLFRVREKKP